MSIISVFILTGLGAYFLRPPIDPAAPRLKGSGPGLALPMPASETRHSPAIRAENDNRASSTGDKSILDNPSTLASAFFGSKNLRAFIDMAKQHPEKGGYSYAFLAGRFCLGVNEWRLKGTSQIAPTVAEEPAFTQHRQENLNTLKQMCQGVTTADYSPGIHG
ncbi:MAG: hypothetical protein WCC58_09665, partial [Burkholderiales bacterium]